MNCWSTGKQNVVKGSPCIYSRLSNKLKRIAVHIGSASPVLKRQYVISIKMLFYMNIFGYFCENFLYHVLISFGSIIVICIIGLNSLPQAGEPH